MRFLLDRHHVVSKILFHSLFYFYFWVGLATFVFVGRSASVSLATGFHSILAVPSQALQYALEIPLFLCLFVDIASRRLTRARGKNALNRMLELKHFIKPYHLYVYNSFSVHSCVQLLGDRGPKKKNKWSLL